MSSGKRVRTISEDDQNDVSKDISIALVHNDDLENRNRDIHPERIIDLRKDLKDLNIPPMREFPNLVKNPKVEPKYWTDETTEQISTTTKDKRLKKSSDNYYNKYSEVLYSTGKKDHFNGQLHKKDKHVQFLNSNQELHYPYKAKVYPKEDIISTKNHPLHHSHNIRHPFKQVTAADKLSDLENIKQSYVSPSQFNTDVQTFFKTFPDFKLLKPNVIDVLKEDAIKHDRTTFKPDSTGESSQVSSDESEVKKHNTEKSKPLPDKLPRKELFKHKSMTRPKYVPDKEQFPEFKHLFQTEKNKPQLKDSLELYRRHLEPKLYFPNKPKTITEKQENQQHEYKHTQLLEKSKMTENINKETIS